MSKAFTRENDDDEEAGLTPLPALPPGMPNYMTPAGHRAIREEFERLVKTERPALVQTISWAASNGDRSENGDYIYGKKRLREMDRRIRYLTKRLENAVVVDPREQENLEQVFFGATVTILEFDDAQVRSFTYQIVGIDEAEVSVGRISWVSPLARALMKSREGDIVRFQSPAGLRELEIEAIVYR